MAEKLLVVVFAKPAVSGSVKTRLIPTLSPDEAAEFHLAALSDTLAVAESIAGSSLELLVAGESEELPEFHALFPGLTVGSQVEGDLGERLSAAFETSFDRGIEKMIVVGSDHPTLPAEYLSQAFDCLDSADIIFGPSRDGGYYAVGLRRGAWPEAKKAFEDIPWSTPGALDASLERVREAELSLALLPEWYDVDRPDDLPIVAGDAQPDSATMRFLMEIWRRRT
jgi:rSAM/selenodomain-associated transferase 1